MTFQDIIKSSFMEQFQTGNLGLKEVLLALGFAVIMALYLFVVYRFFVRKSMYNLHMNLAIVGMTIVTAAVILTIQSNLVLSLGMVGALSIVRYRTAVKDPMDLFFMFWAVASGIMCGANQYILNLAVTVVLTLVVFVLAQLPSTKAPYVLVVNGENAEVEDAITDILQECCSYYKVKSRNISKSSVRIIIELRAKEPKKVTDGVAKLDKVTNLSLLSYEGDVVA
ncbi:MAG: DUF4956 domain-containing protein [Lachnospiraceae bacterium]|nr:DUF4956 domain-containing protein [Lachnospiraceae bacterium]